MTRRSGFWRSVAADLVVVEKLIAHSMFSLRKDQEQIHVEAFVLKVVVR